MSEKDTKPIPMTFEEYRLEQPHGSLAWSCSIRTGEEIFDAGRESLRTQVLEELAAYAAVFDRSCSDMLIRQLSGSALTAIEDCMDRVKNIP